MKKYLLAVCCALLCVPAVCCAQGNYSDSVTITTYYPAPYGVYKNLRLHPSQEPTKGVDKGVMYFNATDESIYYYKNNSAKWVKLGGGGGGGGGASKIVKEVADTPATVVTADCGKGWHIEQCGMVDNERANSFGAMTKSSSETLVTMLFQNGGPLVSLSPPCCSACPYYCLGAQTCSATMSSSCYAAVMVRCVQDPD